MLEKKEPMRLDGERGLPTVPVVAPMPAVKPPKDEVPEPKKEK
jgi:hypothetical protein